MLKALPLLGAMGCFSAMLHGFFNRWSTGALLGLLAGFLLLLAVYLEGSTPRPDTSMPDPSRRPPDPPEQKKLF